MHSHSQETGKNIQGRPIVLVGNPNVGKSAVFGWLTGRYVEVSNYPGTTVEVARGMVMVNRPFKALGLNGKAVLPMVLGLGCDTMATMTTRILETRKERIQVTLLLAVGVAATVFPLAFGVGAGVHWVLHVFGWTL